MNKKKILIATGGTGGHVIPAQSLAVHLNENKYKVELCTDKRGLKFLKRFKNIKINIISSSPFVKTNFFLMILSVMIIFYSILKSILFLIPNRPLIIFGMGGYSSFPICVAAIILRIKYVVYENNLILGKTNKHLLPFANKIFVSYKDLEGISKKYRNKTCVVGNIIKKEIIDISKKKIKNKISKKINILILGGSQAAKIFAEVLPKIFKKCVSSKISIKVYQQCLPKQNKYLALFYKNANVEFEIFNFSNKLIQYFSKINLAITRSGSSVLAELTNANIPFISVPLPSSADNHQLKNAIYYEKKKFSFLIEEKDLNNKLFNLLKSINKNKLLMENIRTKQSQYSDKNVYNNINKQLKKIINEKN